MSTPRGSFSWSHIYCNTAAGVMAACMAGVDGGYGDKAGRPD